MFHRHNPGPLKQHNKPFKSRHSTKGAIKIASKGRTEGVTGGSSKFSNPNKAINQYRQQRKNRNKQIAQSSRDILLTASKSGLSAPKFVAFIPLNVGANVSAALKLVCENCECDPSLNLALLGNSAASLPTVPLYVRTAQKQRLGLMGCGLGDIVGALDLCKVADMVVLVLHVTPTSGRTESEPLLTSEAESVIGLLKTQGIPSPILAVQGFSEMTPAKRVPEAKAMLRSGIQFHLPDVTKPFPIDNKAEMATLVRMVSSQLSIKPLAWRERVPYIVADKVVTSKATSEVAITGYIRSAPLSVNRLVTVTGLGTFQASKIVKCNQDPFSASRKRKNASDGAESEFEVLEVADPEIQESLISQNEVNPMAQEQTWPTEEEIMAAEKSRKKKKVVPKGTSSYQAAWIFDSDNEDVEDDDEEPAAPPPNDPSQTQIVGDDDIDEDIDEEGNEEDDEGMDDGEDDEDGMVDDEDNENGGNNDGDDDDDIEYDDEIDEKLGEDMEEKWRQSREDQEFPDEMDTPQTIPARIRFQKYRGLKSFRTSPWDPHQNLPIDYARIFQLSNYRLMAKRAIAAAANSGVSQGTYITIVLKDIPAEKLAQFDAYSAATASNGGLSPTPRPLIASGLCRNENKTSVVHFSVKRLPTYSDPIKSREVLWFQAGFRRYPARPTFSERTPGISKQKFLRFFQPGMTACASVYGPIAYPPCPVLVFKGEPGTPGATLVASGSLETVDPDVIICKKVVLTALPYKIHKKHVVARKMFFNPEDVNWFKPVELVTKLGRVGTITEAVGTHGVMKCLFDGPLKGHDTICMNLYKRVYPKFVD